MKGRRGFTLIELMIVIVVIGILTTIGVVAYSTVQRNSRDSAHDAEATTIQGALENFYLKNGEYPPVEALDSANASNTAAKVATLIGISADNLVVPGCASGTNPFVSLDDPTTVTTCQINYSANANVNNDACQNATKLADGGCDSYTLTYAKESGDIVALDSRHTSNPVRVPEAPDAPVISVDIGDSTDMAVTSQDAGCTLNNSDLTSKYSFRYSTDGGTTWSSWTAFQVSTEYDVNGTGGTTYTWEGQARCDDGTVQGKTSTPSAPVDYIVPADAPGAPKVTLAESGATLSISSSAVTCASGFQAQYQFRNHVDTSSTGAWSAWTAWSTSTTTPSVTMTTDTKYTYQVEANCYDTTNQIQGTVAASAAVSYTYPIAAPATPSISTTGSSGRTVKGTASSSCSKGTINYEFRDYGGNSTTAGTMSAWTAFATTNAHTFTTGGTVGYRYFVQAAARCIGNYTGTTSAASASATYTVPLTAPAAYSISGSHSSSAISATSNASCPSYATTNYWWGVNGGGAKQGDGASYKSYSYGVNYGQTITLSSQAYCHDAVATSGTVKASNTYSWTRPDMNLSLSTGADNCDGGYCGRIVNSSWNNICGTSSASMRGVELSYTSTWTSDTASSDSIHWKGGSSPVTVTYTVNIGCASQSGSIGVQSAYRCTGCS